MSRLEALVRSSGESRVRVMGIVNCTPDSFHDGGRHSGEDEARSRVDLLVRAGVDVVDLGAESTRPGAPSVPASEQLARLGGIVAYAAEQGVVVSIDTTSPEVAAHALRAGARVINSVSLEPVRALADLAVRHDAALVLTHCRGSMTGMAGFSVYADDAYGDVVLDVAAEWQAAAEMALAAGLSRARLWFDPGLGFAKNAAQSLELCVRLAELKARLGHPVLVGASRKSFVAAAVATEAPPPPSDRLGGSLAAALDAAERGADMVRVHDVAETVQALAYQRAVREAGSRLRSRGGDLRPGTSPDGGAACSRG